MRVAGRDPNGAGASRLGLGAQPPAEARVEQPADREMPLEQFLDAARVVGLFVGDDGDAEANRRRRSSSLARRSSPGGPPSTRTAGAVGRLQQDRVALADVEHRRCAGRQSAEPTARRQLRPDAPARRQPRGATPATGALQRRRNALRLWGGRKTLRPGSPGIRARRSAAMRRRRSSAGTAITAAARAT